MGDEPNFGPGAQRCLECGAPVTIMSKAGAIHTAPGRVLIITGDLLPDGATPARTVTYCFYHTIVVG